MKKHISILFLAFTTVVLHSCFPTKSSKNVDVSKVDLKLSVARFEQDFFEINTANIADKETEMLHRYGEFYNDYVLGMMGFGAPISRVDTVKHDPNPELLEYVSDKNVRHLYDTTQLVFKDFSKVQKPLEDALRHFQYYFSNKKVTQLYTVLSGLHVNELGTGTITYGDSTLVVFLDMYLGANFKDYDYVVINGEALPEFKRRRLCPEYITPHCMEVLYNLHFDKTAYNAELPLIEAMVNEGKRFYFMECMMPESADSLLIGYTGFQAAWCSKSEKNIWQYFSEKDLLYKVNFMEQKRYISDGPSTPGMPPESPGRVGAWLGWQIVRKYMKDADGKVTLSDLLAKVDAKSILVKANYKPK